MQTTIIISRSALQLTAVDLSDTETGHACGQMCLIGNIQYVYAQKWAVQVSIRKRVIDRTA
jgi:hypothetical protein